MITPIDLLLATTTAWLAGIALALIDPEAGIAGAMFGALAEIVLVATVVIT